jgi:hypothetical protein
MAQLAGLTVLLRRLRARDTHIHIVVLAGGHLGRSARMKPR